MNKRAHLGTEQEKKEEGKQNQKIVLTKARVEIPEASGTAPSLIERPGSLRLQLLRESLEKGSPVNEHQ